MTQQRENLPARKHHSPELWAQIPAHDAPVFWLYLFGIAFAAIMPSASPSLDIRLVKGAF